MFSTSDGSTYAAPQSLGLVHHGHFMCNTTNYSLPIIGTRQCLININCLPRLQHIVFVIGTWIIKGTLYNGALFLYAQSLRTYIVRLSFSYLSLQLGKYTNTPVDLKTSSQQEIVFKRLQKCYYRACLQLHNDIHQRLQAPQETKRVFYDNHYLHLFYWNTSIRTHK